MRKHEVALNKTGITFAGITTTLAVVDDFVLGSVTAAQFQSTYELEHVQREDRCGICHHEELLSMWGVQTVCVKHFIASDLSNLV